MMLGVSIEQTADHSLVLGVVPSRLVLEEFDAAFAQGDGDLDTLFAKHQLLRARQEISYDSKVSEGFVGVFDFRAHRCVFPSASSPRQ